MTSSERNTRTPATDRKSLAYAIIEALQHLIEREGIDLIAINRETHNADRRQS